MSPLKNYDTIEIPASEWEAMKRKKKELEERRRELEQQLRKELRLQKKLERLLKEKQSRTTDRMEQIEL